MLKVGWSNCVYPHVLFANVTDLQTILEEVVWFFFKYNITNAYACI